MPDQCCELPQLAHFGNSNTIQRILKRNPELFIQQEKIYRFSGSGMQLNDHDNEESRLLEMLWQRESGDTTLYLV